jgi:hypothetical protein
VGYITGGVLLVAGVLVVLQTREDDVRLAVGAGPTAALIQGRF